VERKKWNAQRFRPQAVAGCDTKPNQPKCLSYRKLQMECMERELNPCNVKKTEMIRKIEKARR
jgi:hypothetical protein